MTTDCGYSRCTLSSSSKDIVLAGAAAARESVPSEQIMADWQNGNIVTLTRISVSRSITLEMSCPACMSVAFALRHVSCGVPRVHMTSKVNILVRLPFTTEGSGGKLRMVVSGDAKSENDAGADELSMLLLFVPLVYLSLLSALLLCEQSICIFEYVLSGSGCCMHVMA